MFGWFAPTCPCDPAAKAWVEESLRWLAEQFGLHLLLERPIILPTAEFFPDAWDQSAHAVKFLFQRVCRYMQVNPESVKLKLYTERRQASARAFDPHFGFAAGTWQAPESPWEPGVVRIEKSVLDRPSDLVGIMAHELAHQRLLGEGRTDPNNFDNELLTDLTVVFHGLGIFLANNPRKSTGQLAYWPRTKLFRPEYLSEPMLGYALAHVAWFREENRPVWARHLRWAPRAVFQQGLRFLQRTADSRFRPVRLDKDREGV
jgi:hypothetical protein